MTTITTNNHARGLLDWQDLTADERSDLDYIDGVDVDNGYTNCRFFRYRGSIYDLHEFERFHTPGEIGTVLDGWDGFQSDSFFSGIAVRFPLEDGRPDYERVVVGRVIS